MTIEIILGILIIVGTIAGTGLGYVLSMRGKREEWAKESREKRLSPVIEYLNEFMGISLRLQGARQREEGKNKELEQSTNDKEREVINKKLLEVIKDEKQAAEQLIALVYSGVWRGCVAAVCIDKQLGDLLLDWSHAIESHLESYLERYEPETYSKTLTIATQILARADEVIIKGGQTSRIKRWTKLIVKICNKLKAKNEPSLL